MKKILHLILPFLTISVVAQKPKQEINKTGEVPVFFIDSIRVDKSELYNYQPTDISAVSVYKDSNAIKLVGPDGKDGVVYIETKKFAKNRYWNYFRTKSSEYAKLVLTPESDTAVQYILNNRVLKSNFEGDLSLIDDKIFKEIKIINEEVLKNEYGITGKSFGVAIVSVKPDDLYKGNEKF